MANINQKKYIKNLGKRLVFFLIILILILAKFFNELNWTKWEYYGKFSKVNFYIRYYIKPDGRTKVQWRAENLNNQSMLISIRDRRYYLSDGTSEKIKDIWAIVKPNKIYTFPADKFTKAKILRIENYYYVHPDQPIKK
ncbi:MAG: hypothetical protein PWP46_180 [Fusobacteriaceae bacterium]|jgi:hypothetical protein|nr:hypothetical protein [Fusobacteriales bacterium]MDN5303301.1 hypothetical protein [Fusobacteriaceae bacterium]